MAFVALAAAATVHAAPQAGDRPPRAGRELPAEVDLRPRFADFGLTPKNQSPRGTCSVFAMTGLMEFELAVDSGKTVLLSEEFLNWASHQTNGRESDGTFFSDALNSIAAYGVCETKLWPYQKAFDPKASPSDRAKTNALTRRNVTGRWIKRWNVKTGMSDAMLWRIRKSLASGHPVVIGMRWPNQEKYLPGNILAMPPEGQVFDGHSIILVGYKDDASQPGGGTVIFRNHAGTGWGDKGYARMPYAYVQAYGNDALGMRIGHGVSPEGGVRGLGSERM